MGSTIFLHLVTINILFDYKMMQVIPELDCYLYGVNSLDSIGHVGYYFPTENH